MLPPDFKDFLKLLNAKQVEYLLIGGYAVGYHGYPRVTGDIDIWVAISPSNAEKIVEVLRKYGFGVPELCADLFLEENRIIRMGYPPMRVEITTGVSGVNFAECFSERVITVIDEIEVNIINLHHLKINKKASGRLKDLIDLENLPDSVP